MLDKLFDYKSFPARWQCGTGWDAFTGWFYILSDVLIAIAYFAIPLLLVYYVSKNKEVQFKKIFYLFIGFILFCGLTHLLDAILFWYPFYRFLGLIKFITALISLTTVYYLFKIIPEALHLKSPQELQKQLDEKSNQYEIILEQLRLRNETIEASLKYNPDTITIFDKERRILYINNTGTETLVDPNVVGKRVEDLMYPKTHVQLHNESIDAVYEQSISKTIHFNIETAEGERVIESRYLPLFNNNKVYRVLAISRDITEKERKNADLQNDYENLEKVYIESVSKNDKLKNFTFLLTHDLRSPLNNLDGLINIYNLTSDSHEREEIFVKIQEAVIKMKSNTDELLEIAKNVENSKLTKSKINVERQLLNAIGNFETMLIQKDAEVDYSIQYLNSLDFPRIIFDSVCRNLISNAIKYSHPNRKLKLKIYDQKLDDKIVLVFEDNGIGIDLAEHGDKLFKIGTNFHQNSDSKGVGLYLIKNQLESQGGSIFVESKPSEGTKFIVAFH